MTATYPSCTQQLSLAMRGGPYMDQAKSAGKNFLWHLAQCGEDTNLDRHGRLPCPGHPETALSPGYEPFQVITLFGGQSLCPETADFHLSVQRKVFSPEIR